MNYLKKLEEKLPLKSSGKFIAQLISPSPSEPSYFEVENAGEALKEEARDLVSSSSLISSS